VTKLAAITFPARPINGGALERALPKVGRWRAEPKWDGWRLLLHVPSGAMFNRLGEPLSIGAEFNTAARWLRDQPDPTIIWLDCEALARRHKLARGTLIVLDAVLPHRTYLERRMKLLDRFTVPSGGEINGNSVYLTPSEENALLLYDSLRGNPLFEGVVCKREDSLYPIQLSDPKREYPKWIKHRWR
jgi:ATP-dependent DNA ligase